MPKESATSSDKPTVVLGFDYGLRRIGVAVGQSLTGTAQALSTVTARDGVPDWDAIGALIAEWRPQALIVGVPYNMDGSEQPITRRAQRFARQLEGRFALGVHLVDERLTSAEAEEELRTQRAAGRRRRVRREEIDARAARIIVEDWLRHAAQQGSPKGP